MQFCLGVCDDHTPYTYTYLEISLHTLSKHFSSEVEQWSFDAEVPSSNSFVNILNLLFFSFLYFQYFYECSKQTFLETEGIISSIICKCKYKMQK